MKNFMNVDRESRFNEILFENRNKKYGAYALRMDEGRILQKSLFIGIAFFASLSVLPLIVNSLKGAEIITELPPEIAYNPRYIPDEPPVVVTPVVPNVPVNTVSLEVPTPTKNPEKQTTIPPVSERDDAVIGPETIEGPPPTTFKPPVVNVVVPPSVVKPPVVINSEPGGIPTRVDVEASFNGGINAFRSKVVQNFDGGNFDGTGNLIKTTVTFVVEKDGTISGIKASGPNAEFNKEAESTIKNIKGKWLPAKLDGKNVRSYFNFPISMQFE